MHACSFLQHPLLGAMMIAVEKVAAGCGWRGRGGRGGGVPWLPSVSEAYLGV
jgi:hypothetical protein